MKKLLIVSTALIAVTGATSQAITNNTPISADEKPPIVLQVENHEERITGLEDKTDKTQTQVNQNTADIGELQANTGTSPADPVEPVKTPVNRTPSTPEEPKPSEPTPEPIDLHTIISVTDVNGTNTHTCTYTIQTGQRKAVITGYGTECYKVGTILPEWLWPK